MSCPPPPLATRGSVVDSLNTLVVEIHYHFGKTIFRFAGLTPTTGGEGVPFFLSTKLWRNDLEQCKFEIVYPRSIPFAWQLLSRCFHGRRKREL